MPDIFISYDSADRITAEAFARIFRANRWSVWWDRDIPPGAKFHERIAESLRAARCVVVLWSRNSVTSDWVRDEAGEGARRQILVPVLVDDVEIPLGFRQIHAARLIGWNEQSHQAEVQVLLEAIATVLNERPIQAPVTAARHRSRLGLGVAARLC